MSVTANPPGVVSSSQDEPLCVVPGCENCALPDSDTCGLVEHQGASMDSDGTVTGAVDVSGGLTDGTGRDRKPRWKPRGGSWRNKWSDGEVRVVGADDDTIRVSGTAICYSPWTTIYDEDGPFQERFVKTAADSVLDDGSERFLLLGHDWNKPLASTHAGNLWLKNDLQGLQMAADLDASSPTVRDVASSIASGVLRGMSFCFVAAPEGDLWSPDLTRRTVSKLVELPEVTLTPRPAYPQTSVALRDQQLLRRDVLRARGERLRREARIAHVHREYR